MAYSLSEDINLMLDQLIQHTTGLDNESEISIHIHKKITTYIKNTDSLYFINQKELDRIVESLCKKFEFHGFSTHAKELRCIYGKLIPGTLSKSDHLNRMNVIKFILCMSESPTTNAYKFPRRFEKGDEEEIIDWPKYLKEDIPEWLPSVDDDSSDSWSDIINENGSPHEENSTLDCFHESQLNDVSHQNNAEDCFKNQHDLKINLLNGVQSRWFNSDNVCFKPPSSDRDANVALAWENHIKDCTKSLIPIQSSNIVSEYKIMREVIWQLYEPHTSCCFGFNGDLLLPTANVTISSVRLKAFESFLYSFIPYINWLQDLREFQASLDIKSDDEDILIPDTYRSYNDGILTIIQPVFVALQEIENEIKAQETTLTLLTLAHRIRPLFQKVKVLKDIHDVVILDFKNYSPLHCSTTLLLRLHQGLLYASTKTEQDLFLTLYLHSLYKYFTTIDSWLCRDILEDRAGEFPIADENPKDMHVLMYQTVSQSYNQNTLSTSKSKTQQGEQDWQMEFFLKDQTDYLHSNIILNLISTKVLQIGKNIHLLRLLGKLNPVPEFTRLYRETFYEAYIDKVLKSIAAHFNVNYSDSEALDICDTSIQPSSPTFVFPATCTDHCKYLTEMDRLENLVDTSDGFLVQAFQSFFIKNQTTTKKKTTEKSLYEKITSLTKSLFPVHKIIENIFVELLNERFSTSGLLVKNVLINDYNLQKHFMFLSNIYLFNEDLIFPFYRNVFVKFDSGGIWGNQAWLTPLLHDLIMDTYPDLYRECTVEVKDSWKLCSDPLKACRMVNVNYRIKWPVNIIIREEHIDMYKKLFQFILQIKWALYTLNHLYFSELVPKGQSWKHQNKSLRLLISKLKILRFGLVNIMSNIQHYVLGYVYNKHSNKFDKAIEEAYDLETLMKAHSDFIHSLYKTCSEFQEYNNNSYGFYLLLYLIRKLRTMWQNKQDIKDEELEKCVSSYLKCHKNIDPIINPSRYAAYLKED